MSDDRWNDDRDNDLDNDRDDDRDNDLGTRGDKDTMRGKANQAAGNVQEKAGELFNNEKMQRHGEEKQLKGDLQEGAGKAERTIDDTLDS